MTAALSNDEIEERYFLLGRMEILNVLNELIHRRETVTVYFHGGQEFILTTLLEARHDALIFDLGGDAKANLRLPRSRNCIFVARLNGIRVQFSGGQPELFSWGGSNAFSIPLPDRVVRLQRRESFRILLPVAKPLMVKLYADDSTLIGEWPSHDMSVGGVGITVTGTPQLEEDQQISRLQFLLPKRVINCPAVIRHITQVGEQPSGARYRVGLAFSGLPPAMGVQIQRFIIKVEHERRKLASGSR